MAEFPGEARVVVIGGGIIGASTAYHLAKLGLGDVLLLERHKLTSGSTFHAAGLVGQLRSNANVTQLLGESVKLYRRLEQETGLATGWKMNGGLRLACNEERWTEVRRQATTARSFGLEMHLLSPKEAQDLWPLMDVSDVVGAAFLPTDGQANPSDITASLAKGARMHGAKIVEGVEVTGVRIEGVRVVAVETTLGAVRCETVVNCAGQWAREVGRMAGVSVPLVSVEHQYMITERIEGVASTLPTLRDPDRLTYYKEEVGGLVMGGYEPNPIPWAVEGFPQNFEFQLLPSNFDHFEQLMELALGRVPALQTAGVKELINGPESFTPDGNFILGRAPELDNFYVGAGFNAFGIASGGGAGKALAEWIFEGRPPYDLSPVDILRFGAHTREAAWVRARTLEAYAKHYTIAWPHEEHASGRPTQTSPLYERLKARGAAFGEKLGWERPNWFAGACEEPKDRYTFGRPNWTAAVAREHKAAREAVALFDQSSFAKFTLEGPDAEAAMAWLSPGVFPAPGRLAYAPMLNASGGVECDVTAARLKPDAFYLVCGTGAATHHFDWIRRNIPEGLAATLVDRTGDFAALSVMGPRSRELLQGLTEDDLSDAAFGFGTAREIGIAGARAVALRMSFVGELGYELHVPVGGAVALYDALVAAGAPLGLVDAGYRAIETLRLEKFNWAFGADVGPDHGPLEAGLGWALRDDDRPFLGREALEASRAAPLRKRLACFTVEDPDVVLLGRETIYRNGERVGWLSSGGFGHTVGKPIGYGYVRRAEGVDDAFVLSGDYELDVATARVPAKVHLAALYDPQMRRMLDGEDAAV